MTNVLVDTGPLVALFDERDALHQRALAELDRIRGQRWISLPVLTEATHLLGRPRYITRLHRGIAQDLFRLAHPSSWQTLVERSLSWMEQYSEHEPDFADAFLVAWAEADRSLAIWTFDKEFRDIWRTRHGKRLKLAVAPS